ncbi:MAG TPA: T9SS type A sorting domain-containing protein [Ignavibacteria bacterium]|nr:T9SS type A sorting domain-containing protein [Ignavibacteria bacterium]HMQ97428.1 T9SS type A sorting domain-containing protein [Ignavibacteria bacterium]
MKEIIYLMIGFCLISQIQSQWTTLDTGFPQILTSISAVDDNVVWTCGHLGKVCRTTNGGASWDISVVTPDTSTLNNVYGLDQNTAFVSAKDYSPSSSSVWKTTDGGSSWQQVFSQPNGEIYSLEVFSNGTGIMIGKPFSGRWSLFKTSNYGSTWDSAGMFVPGSGGSTENSLYTRDNEYWFGASGGRLYYSSNSGINWSYQTLGSTNIIGIWFNGQTGIATGSGGFRTTNGGISWSPLTIPGTGNQLPISGYGTNFWMITRGSINIYNTTNNGDNWSNYSSVYQYSDIAASRSGSRIWIATLSQYVLKDVVNSVSQISSQIPRDYELLQNYPNPFNPVTNIEFSIPKSSFITLTIYDISGREIEVLVNQNMNAGTYKADWDASKYSSGIYFYRYEAGEYSETKKMILVK